MSEKKFKANELSHMDVIFAAINKFLRFLSGLSHTHRFRYQPVNLCLRHYEIRFPWMKCWPKQGENNIAEKLVFSSSAFPSTPSKVFSSPLLFFRISYHEVGKEKQTVSSVCIFSKSREDLTVGQMGFEKSEVQQVIWNGCCLLLF